MRGHLLGFWFSILAFLGVTTLWFGDPLSALWIGFMWPAKVASPHWWMAPGFCAVAIAIPMFIILRPYVRPALCLPLVMATSISLSVVAIGLHTEYRREAVIAGFGADEIVRSSIFRSIREAPREFQFFLHAAALKNGVCYAWSYREMRFYALPPNVGRNVLPSAWLPKCSIT